MERINILVHDDGLQCAEKKTKQISLNQPIRSCRVVVQVQITSGFKFVQLKNVSEHNNPLTTLL